MLHSLWLPRGCINSKHCLPLYATGLEVGDNSVEKMLFSKTILSHSTTPYLGYFLCIPVVRFLMRGHLSRVSKAYQTTKANFIPTEKLPILKLLPSLVSCSLFCQLLSWRWCCNHFCHFLLVLAVKIEHEGKHSALNILHSEDHTSWRNEGVYPVLLRQTTNHHVS